MNHELRWAATPKGLLRDTPWGWRSCCTCEWEQTGLAGTKKDGYRAWRAHRQAPEITHLYFAFGMNLDPDYMPGCERVGSATLSGWKLRFRYFATVERCAGAEVYGGLWQITEKQLGWLDGREGYPRMYGRETVTVETTAGPRQAIVYTLGTNPPPVDPPAPDYLGMIRRGYEYFGLGAQAYDELERRVIEAEEVAA